MTHTIKRYVQLFNASTATSGPWVPLDVRYETKPSRILTINLTTGDTVAIQGTTKDIRGPGYDQITPNLTAADIATITSVTTSGFYEVSGPWTFIRVTKTGTAGNATVEGMV